MARVKVHFNNGGPMSHTTDVVAHSDNSIHAGNGTYATSEVSYVEFSDGRATLTDLLGMVEYGSIEIVSGNCTVRSGSTPVLKCKVHELYQALWEVVLCQRKSQ